VGGKKVAGSDAEGSIAVTAWSIAGRQSSTAYLDQHLWGTTSRLFFGPRQKLSWA